tara:strand:- start:684 stop:1475 length:792 start_codon:yes stop_codon:yes gene_type:complete
MSLIQRLQERTGGTKDYLSYSTVKYALEDMRLFELKYLDKLKKKTQALSFGSLYDCLLMTPEEFDDRFVMIDDDQIVEELKTKGIKNPRATKVYKDYLRKLEQDNPDKEMVNADDHTQAIDMITRLEDCGAKDLYLTGKYQVEFKKPIPTKNHGDVMMRGFLDCLGKTFICDSKSCQNLNGFKYDIFKYGYPIQAYLYLTAFDLDEFYWLAQSKVYPYTPGVYKASEETLKLGENKFNQAIDTIADFLESDKGSETHYLIQTI